MSMNFFYVKDHILSLSLSSDMSGVAGGYHDAFVHP